MKDNEAKKAADFAHAAIREISGLEPASSPKVLDFGCGAGGLVKHLLSFGYDIYGCDITEEWSSNPDVDQERFGAIGFEPYRLPFDDGTFDVVISTSVLEHAQNKEECFREIHRVLKRGGYSMHLYPAKWYLPLEVHISVPLASHFWPHCPQWWLALWAMLGVRNRFQKGKTWREVVKSNLWYCEHRLCYWPNRRYRQLSQEIFGNYSAPMEFYIHNAYGGFARLFRKLPFKRLSGWLSGAIRMNFIVQRKTD